MDLGQVFTNRAVADYMVSLFSLDKSATIVDPCFGDGSFLNALEHGGYKNVIGYEIDKNLFAAVSKNNEAFFLYNTDFLSVDASECADGIIMNPPYIRQEKIDELAPLGITKSHIRKNPMFAQLPSTANMYMYFILKAISLLKDNGELVVVFPGSWLTARSGKQFEKLMYSQCVLLEQIHLSGDVFEKNVLTDVLILKLKKCSDAVSPKTEHVIFSDGKCTRLNPKAIKADISLDFSKNFNAYGIIRRGMSTGYNAMYINPPFADKDSRAHLKKILSSPKEIQGYSTLNSRPDYVFIPDDVTALSDEVKNYITEYERKIRLQASPKTLYDKMQNDKNWFALHAVDSSGILFSYFVRNDMKFIYNESDYLARDNFYVIRQNEETDGMVLFALLNNYYTFYQLEKSGKKYGAGLLKLQRYDLENLMFPDISRFRHDDVERLKVCAARLISENDGNAISEITKTISRYSSVAYDVLLNEYRSVKAHRLGTEYVG